MLCEQLCGMNECFVLHTSHLCACEKTHLLPRPALRDKVV